jgi:hypothetical protein
MIKAQTIPADTQPSEPCLVVFGRDEAGKPHASWFDAQSAELAVKAAELMQMRVLKVETEEQRAIARQLAPGRVFASGRAFTPFARANLYSKLVELAGGRNRPHRRAGEHQRHGGPGTSARRLLGGQYAGPRGGARRAKRCRVQTSEGERTGCPAACANADRQPSAADLGGNRHR